MYPKSVLRYISSIHENMWFLNSYTHVHAQSVYSSHVCSRSIQACVYLINTDVCIFNRNRHIFPKSVNNCKYSPDTDICYPPVFSGLRVTRSLVLCVCFVDRYLSLCPFSFGQFVVCSSSISGF